MKLMVIGGGGREHAIIKKLKENPAVEKIYCLPGNGGIAADAVCVPVGAKDIDGLVALAQREQVDFMPAQFDIVTALHACDTATDDAIAFGLEKRAQALVLVPCCQAELAAAMRQNKALHLARTPLAELWRHPIHTREIGSHLTNVLRCLYLEACGYQVTVTELVGWEHSMKNELIIARHTGQKKRSAVQRLRELLEQFGLQEALAHRYPALPPSE